MYIIGEKERRKTLKTEMNNSENFNTESHKDIISKILSEKESDEQALEKMYKMLLEASAADDLTMDTNLIDECIKTIGMLEGSHDNIPPEKLRKMKQEIKSKYRDSKEKGHKQIFRKKIVRVAACLVLVFFITFAVADAFGFNPVKMIVSWKEDTFNLSARNENNNVQDNNMSGGLIFVQMEDALENIKPAPMMPEWIPEGFSFKYAEKFVRSDNTNILLNYEDDDGKVIIFDYVIYNDAEKNTEGETSFEKDSNEVEIYKKNGTDHYIFSNLDQVQAVWGRLNTIYNINGDISTDEIKKIIDSMWE